MVVGGGHAGAEAAWAAARLGARTALITFSRDAIGRMSCNPAIGGIGKGQIVREIDALGGLMGIVTDEAGIQFRMLNRRKGPAVWSPRAQCDREEYAGVVRRHLENCAGLTIIEGGVEAIEADEEIANETAINAHEPNSAVAPRIRRAITGVVLSDGRRINTRAVIVTSGTFLRALMHTGERKTPGGRVGEAAAGGLSGSLAALGLRLGRLKTGTPPRIARDSIDYSQLDEQHGDAQPAPFSLLTNAITQSQVCCWISWTTPEVHSAIRENLHRAPMYSGQIQSCGPRYCPSIEDKIVRFGDKERHQLSWSPKDARANAFM